MVFHADKETQQKLTPHTNIAFDGVYTDRATCIKITTGSLSSKRESASTKKYALTLHSLVYVFNSPSEVCSRSFDLDFASPLPGKASGSKVLLVRPDHCDSMVAAVVNSTHKYYCQILIVSLHTDFGIL